MNNFIFKNLNLVFIDEDFNIKINNNEIWVKDGVYCDNKHKREDFEIIDCGGRVGFVDMCNFHHHIYSQLSKGMPVNGDMSNFYNVLKNLWWKLDKVLFKEAVQCSAQIAGIESIKSGVTTTFDHHASFEHICGSLEDIGDVLIGLGIDNVLCFETSDRNGNDIFYKSVQENVDYIKKVKDNVRRKAMFGLHAPFTLNDNSLKYIMENIPSNTGLHFHLAEDKLDISESIDKFNKDIVDRILDYNLVNDKTIIGHCNHINKKQFEKLALKNPAIAHNPASNMNNAVGVLNFNSIKDMNISFLPGTDGMHSNILSSIKTAFLLYRHINSSSNSGFDLVEKMIKDSAYFGRKFFNNMYNLKVNTPAKLTITDYIPYTEFDVDNFLGHFIYGITESRICTVYNRKMLMKDYNLCNIDEQGIIKYTREISKKLWKKL
ncbi:MAG: amidohydrolase family protein [Candidatus Muirbacterium halophilum]|nr:amidohydrolase family protein [Candidatus Muirbacterium halophilum]